ncbi:unnamed protein product [Xylocopa violacea]|uniref:Uncharacterized protein n=1 Tax=Xylocopa violacea TaxID=135666 RepID=A0ABP1PF00_XYLVO
MAPLVSSSADGFLDDSLSASATSLTTSLEPYPLIVCIYRTPSKEKDRTSHTLSGPTLWKRASSSINFSIKNSQQHLERSSAAITPLANDRSTTATSRFNLEIHRHAALKAPRYEPRTRGGFDVTEKTLGTSADCVPAVH